MSAVEHWPLCDLVKIVGGGTPSRECSDYFSGEIPWVTVKDFGEDSILYGAEEHITPLALENSASRLIPAGNVLVVTRMAVGRVAINLVDVAINQDIKALLCGPRVLPEFLRYFIVQCAPKLAEAASGATVKGITVGDLERQIVPLPPLDEQCQVAARLAQADRLRRTRRFTLQLSDTFLQSAFVDLFGSPEEILIRWDHRPIGELFADEPRNGLSPSKAGKIPGRVLTLSAITQGGFNSEAAKDAMFAKTPPASKRLDVRDFLVCRGNGNIQLVGSGHFPDRSNADLVFPDTMIAIRPDETSLVREFLEVAWSTPPLRRQIEAAARTTNGTFKINQDSLSEIEVPVPPLPIQKRFAALVTRFERHRARLREAERQADHLFQRLLADAFSDSN